jgi:hypothetical protein
MRNRESMTESAKRFGRIWAQTKPMLESGKVIPTGFSEGRLIELEYILALVAVAEAQRADVIPQILAIQNKLRSADPTHYYYPPSSFHLTVAGCTPFYKERRAISEERISRVFQICSEVIQEWYEPLSLHIKGLNAILGSVFLQVFSPDGAFGRLRQRVLEALKTAGEEPIEQLDTGQIHMNIMKFTHTDHVKLQRLVAAIEPLRDVEISEFVIDNVELDITDRVQSPYTTRLIHRFSLAR